MSRIRGQNTKPEMLVRRFLHSKGFRYRLHVKDLPGKPDIVLPKYKKVILIHGCFWHSHKACKFAAVPASNIEYWTPKLLNNVARDKSHIKELKKLGWNVIVIWECELKNNKISSTLETLINCIAKGDR